MQSVVYPQTAADTSDLKQVAAIERFKQEFSRWLDTAPEQLTSNRLNNNAFGSTEWYSLMYHHSILLLYRHRLVYRERSNQNDDEYRLTGSATNMRRPPPTVFIDCADSAQSICMIYRQLYVSQRLNDTWGALHVLFLAGVTFLHCLWSSSETRAIYRMDKVSSICTSTMIVLAIMAERWSAVNAYRDAFEMLATATQTMLAETLTVLSRDTYASAQTMGNQDATNPSNMLQTPRGPVIPSGEHDQFTEYLSYMSEVGMCSSVEELLASMV
jgi:hypothetical protein